MPLKHLEAVLQTKDQVVRQEVVLRARDQAAQQEVVAVALVLQKEEQHLADLVEDKKNRFLVG